MIKGSVVYIYAFQDSQACRYDQIFVLSENQVISEFYTEVAAAMLKGYMLIQMGYMYQTVMGLGKLTQIFVVTISISIICDWRAYNLSTFHDNALENHDNRSELLRAQYVYNLTAIQADVKVEIRNASRSMWACDPNDFHNQGKIPSSSSSHQTV